MVEARDRLMLALKVENDFKRFNPGEELVELRAQWAECRRIVNQFADDYATAIERWRAALPRTTELMPRAEGRQEKQVGRFQHLFAGGVQRIGLHR